MHRNKRASRDTQSKFWDEIGREYEIRKRDRK
jgi:hypothetical protein